MRVVAHTTSNGYNLKELEKALVRREEYKEKNVWVEESDLVLYFKHTSGSEAFYFNEGVVCWNPTDKEEKDKIDTLALFATDPLGQTETEEIEFQYRKSGKSDIHKDTAYIVAADIKDSMSEKDKEKERLREQEEKLMVSYAMVRSTKLNALEARVEEAVEAAKPIPTALATKGKLGLSTTSVNQQIGKLMELKFVINLYSGIKEEPDLCWDKPELESLYFKAAKNFALHKRINAMNSKLEYVGEVVEVLLTQAYHSHSGFLEWIIIILIVMEVFFSMEEKGFMLNLYFPYKRLEEYLQEKNH